nr:MAG TPA: hypothetical protein [Caudoviricetes sp.]
MKTQKLKHINYVFTMKRGTIKSLFFIANMVNQPYNVSGFLNF